MGASDSAKQGYPKSLQKKDWEIYLYCGGAGGGGCAVVQNNTQVRFGIEMNPYITRQDSILLRNPEFFGIVLYPDAGVSGFCDHSYVLGTEVDWYLGFSNDGVLTDQEVRDQNLLQTAGAPPFDIEVSGNKLPQPTDSDWSGIMYVHIHWTDSLYVSDQEYVDDIQYLRVVQHNYQVRQ
jgi:hypothetical protein